MSAQTILATSLREARGNTRASIEESMNKGTGQLGMTPEEKEEEIDKADAKAQHVADATASAIAQYVYVQAARAAEGKPPAAAVPAGSPPPD